MARQHIGYIPPDDDTLPEGTVKINDNFQEVDEAPLLVSAPPASGWFPNSTIGADLSSPQALTNKSVNGVTLTTAGTTSQSLRADGSYQQAGDMLASVYDPAGITEQLVGLDAPQPLTNKSVNGVTLTDSGDGSLALTNDGTYQRLSALGIFAAEDEGADPTATPTQNTTGIQAAIDKAEVGGGIVTITKPGVYDMADAGVDYAPIAPYYGGGITRRYCLVVEAPNVYLSIGPGVTLRVADNQINDANGPFNIVMFFESDNVGILGAGVGASVIQGNTAGQPGWTGASAGNNQVNGYNQVGQAGDMVCFFQCNNSLCESLTLEDHWGVPYVSYGATATDRTTRSRNQILEDCYGYNCGEGFIILDADDSSFLRTTYEATAVQVGDGYESGRTTRFRGINLTAIGYQSSSPGSGFDMFAGIDSTFTNITIDSWGGQGVIRNSSDVTTIDIDAATDIDGTANTWIAPSDQNYPHGTRFLYQNNNGNADIPGLTEGTNYYLHRITPDTYTFHPTYLDAINDTNGIDVEPGTGTHRIVTSNGLGNATWSNVTVRNTGAGSSIIAGGEGTAIYNGVYVEGSNTSQRMFGTLNMWPQSRLEIRDAVQIGHTQCTIDHTDGIFLASNITIDTLGVAGTRSLDIKATGEFHIDGIRVLNGQAGKIKIDNGINPNGSLLNIDGEDGNAGRRGIETQANVNINSANFSCTWVADSIHIVDAVARTYQRFTLGKKYVEFQENAPNTCSGMDMAKGQETVVYFRNGNTTIDFSPSSNFVRADGLTDDWAAPNNGSMRCYRRFDGKIVVTEMYP